MVPALIESFLANLRIRQASARDLSEQEVHRATRATLTLLLRVLFLLQAEARGIQLVDGSGRQWEATLRHLSMEVTQAAGPVEGEVPSRIADAYSNDPSATRLYGAVLGLVRTVRALLAPDLLGPEATPERFLDTVRIPDRYLALALDRLVRDEPGEGGTLGWVDFAALPVRFLGSIYESLLSLRPRVSAGPLHFERDRRRQKATGSYYTPDHIVRCIVDQAVGPPLDDHLERLRQSASLSAFGERARVRGEANSLSPQGEWAGVRGVDKLFDFRVLDPSMGSGNFLVQAVDFIAERILAFLEPLHPSAVEVVLLEARRSSQETGEANNPRTLDLLRQLVLERCIYGVDIDPVAVELARMTLWLQCATPGVRPAYLRRHLRCGNALVGIRPDEVDWAVEKRGQRDGAVTRLNGLPEAGRCLLDLYTSRWFGSGAPNGRGSCHAPDLRGDFLKSDRAERWLRGGCRPEVLKGTDSELVERGIGIARAHHFFHWEIEFPEAFFRPDRRTHRERPGFDAVIGNPPWGATMPPELKVWSRERFPSLGHTEPDYFAAFLDVALRLVRSGGSVGLLLPDILLLKNYPEARLRLLTQLQLANLTHWGQPFEGVNLDACSVVGRRVDAPAPRRQVRCVVHPPDRRRGAHTVNYVEQGRFIANTDCRFNLHLGRRLQMCLDYIRRSSRPLGTYLEFHEGIHSGNVRAKLFVDEYAGPECQRLLLRGSEVSPFRIDWDGKWVRYDRALVDRAAGEYANLGHARYFTRPKLLVRRTGDRIIAARDDRGFCASNNFFVAQPRPGMNVPLAGLESLLNSRLATWFFRAIQPRTGRLFAEVKITHLRELPVPVALTDADWNWLSTQADEIRSLLTAGNTAAPRAAHTRSQCEDFLLEALKISWKELERAYPAGSRS